MKIRDRSLDILRGIGILFMVFDHVGWGAAVHTYIQSFHMPLFFIVSGYLWKNEDVPVLVKKRFKTLMIPYIVFAVFYWFLQLLPALGSDHNLLNSLKAVLLYPTDMDNMPFAPALWFLPCMFLTTIIYSLISRLSFIVKAVVIMAIAVLGMIYSSLSNVMLPFAVEPSSVALGFILVGELIQRKQDNVMKLLNKYWLVLILLIVEAVLALVNGSVDLRSARYHNCIIYIINSVVGTLAYWGIARKINAMKASIPVRKGVYWLSFLSQNAMGYICMNQLFITLFSIMFTTVVPSETIAIVASKSMIFIAVMVIIYWITRMIITSPLRIVFGLK